MNRIALTVSVKSYGLVKRVRASVSWPWPRGCDNATDIGEAAIAAPAGLIAEHHTQASSKTSSREKLPGPG